MFYEVNLEAIVEKGDVEAFNYFYHIFRAENFATQEEKESAVHQSLAQNKKAQIAIEDDLRNVIYGTEGKDSIFEKIGVCIYKRCPTAPLGEVYQSALYFTFRLLFIAYFEDKFDVVLEKHSCFKEKISLQTLLEGLENNKKSFVGIGDLNRIFKMYDQGEPHYDMPVFNGGLFDDANAPLLKTPQIFSNGDLREILKGLFYFEGEGKKSFRRDYRTLSVAHLGTIYEGLLSYFFKIAEEDLVYATYTPKKGEEKSLDSTEAFLDVYDYENIQKNCKIIKESHYKKGAIYLRNTSNSRKSTASYYTPQPITEFLVESALKGKLNDSNILHFKILDNACGSGHFLVEALNQITEKVQENFDDFGELKKLFEAEKAEIQNNICAYISDYQADDAAILKRLLLKCVIFGVDANPFSVELTKLSLWIDSFIFGTPLSFLEHHIKCGNALIGTTIKELGEHYSALKRQKSELGLGSFLGEFQKLGEVFERLDSIKDTTEKDILESKRLYLDEITPILKRLNFYLNAFTAKSFLDKKTQDDLETNFIYFSPTDKKFNPVEKFEPQITALAQKHRFFNYEIEFPEIVSEGRFVGFDAIIGNPPWDKTKFSENDFFPQFHSRYRTLTESKKKEIRENLLSKDYIKQEFEEKSAEIKAQNDYYKTHFPLNAGSGDGNLFRFFVEQNLKLLAKGASLNYVLPSALMLEKGSERLRKNILEHKTLQFFYSFENRKGIFRDVDSRYKFALMQIENRPPCPNHTIKTMFYKTEINEAQSENNAISLTLSDIQTLSPAQFALQEVRSKRDLEILKKCYARFAHLDSRWLDFRNELHMTNDKDLFIEKGSKNYREGLLPLYEGKMIAQFNAAFENPRYFLDPVAFDERIESKEIHRAKGDLGKAIGKKFDTKTYKKLLEFAYPTMSESAAEDSFIAYDRAFYRLGFRAIVGNTNERTLIFSLLPKKLWNGK